LYFIGKIVRQVLEEV